MGKCCAGLLDGGGQCCEAGALDECGVCNGHGESCGVFVQMEVRVDSMFFLDDPNASEYRRFASRFEEYVASLLGAQPQRVALMHAAPADPDLGTEQPISGNFGSLYS